MARSGAVSQVSGSLRESLANDERYREWLQGLEAIGEPDFDVALPPIHQLAPVLLELAIPHEDIDTLIALAPTVVNDPDLWWLLTRCVHVLVSKMGTIGRTVHFQELPESLGILRRFFYVYVFLATLPHTKAYHQSRGIPPETSRRTFADLGRHIAVNRKRHGVGGLHAPGWQTLHYTGALYDLGRLQFERSRLGATTSEGIRAAGYTLDAGELTLSVHIPDFSGPMFPNACDQAFDRAREFFARHFPDERFATAVCHSWLLDDQLPEYLPESSNIIQFQRRFRQAYRPNDNDDGALGFVFGRTLADLDGLPRDTLLQRAIVDHIRSGRHWRGGSGWLELS